MRSKHEAATTSFLSEGRKLLSPWKAENDKSWRRRWRQRGDHVQNLHARSQALRDALDCHDQAVDCQHTTKESSYGNTHKLQKHATNYGSTHIPTDTLYAQEYSRIVYSPPAQSRNLRKYAQTTKLTPSHPVQNNHPGHRGGFSERGDNLLLRSLWGTEESPRTCRFCSRRLLLPLPPAAVAPPPAPRSTPPAPEDDLVGRSSRPEAFPPVEDGARFFFFGARLFAASPLAARLALAPGEGIALAPSSWRGAAAVPVPAPVPPPGLRAAGCSVASPPSDEELLASTAAAVVALPDEDCFVPPVARPFADLTFFLVATPAGSPGAPAGVDAGADSSRPRTPCCRRAVAWSSPTLPPSRAAASFLPVALTPTALACSPCDRGRSLFSSPSSTEHCCCCSASSTAYTKTQGLKTDGGVRGGVKRFTRTDCRSPHLGKTVQRRLA